MTTYRSETQICRVCGASVECTILNSTNEFGSPDLDLRPPEMKRSTMDTWLHECPDCGYVSGDLNRPTVGAKATMESEPYAALLADSGIPELARRFARYSLLQHADPETAGVALIRAAWACDDANDAERARAYRTRAADILLTLRPFADGEEQATLAAVLVDVLRRAERFGEAKALATELLSSRTIKANDIVASVLQYQCRLCDDGDAECHNVAERHDGG